MGLGPRWPLERWPSYMLMEERSFFSWIYCRYPMALINKKNQKASKQSNLPRQPHVSYRIWCTPLASTGGRCDLAPTLHFQPHLPRGHHTLSPSQTHPLPVSQASLVFSSLHPSLCSHCSNRLEFLLFSASPFRTFRARFIHWLHHQARIHPLPLSEPQIQHFYHLAWIS